MRLRANMNLLDFFDTVKKCKHDVFFQTSEGDSLNLKSLLSQCILASILDNPELIETGHVVCELDDDRNIISDFFTK